MFILDNIKLYILGIFIFYMKYRCVCGFVVTILFMSFFAFGLGSASDGNEFSSDFGLMGLFGFTFGGGGGNYLVGDKVLPPGWSPCPGGKKAPAVYCSPSEKCSSSFLIGSFCQPDPTKPQPQGKKVCTNGPDGKADWNAQCDEGDTCVTKSNMGFVSADCAKKPVNCNQPGSNCCPSSGGYFNGAGGDTAKVCDSNSKCVSSPQGSYPTCVADPSKPKQDHTYCKGRSGSDGAFSARWCPSGTKCDNSAGRGFPVCLPDVPSKLSLLFQYN